EGEATAEAGDDPHAELIAAADPAAGETVFRKCQACHRLEEGQNLVGPYLYGVVGREIASVEGFGYSDALASKEGAWEFDSLFDFLHDPQGWAPGTIMGFAGLEDDQDKADVIAYMNEQSDAPVELGGAAAADGGEAPDAAEEPAAEEDTAAEEPAAEEDAAAAPAAEGEAAAAAEDAEAKLDAAAEGGDGDDERYSEQQSGTDELEPGFEAESDEAAADGAAAEGEAAAAPEPGSAAPAEPEEIVDPEVETSAEVEANPTTALTEILDEERVDPLPEAEGETAAAEGDEGDDQFAALLASADPAAGEQVYRQCQACHRLEDGQNLIGPHLYGIVGRGIASVESYSYSPALAGKEGRWEPETLDTFLADPLGWAPGTKMGYAGLDDPQGRADLIAYLNQASDEPMQFGAVEDPDGTAAARPPADAE
ncbi:MAG TPA: cytochrome c family protein, partial [Thermohalobaculum sp.]|nr:cytochrome c family protein [Thermohalobaculum sp.]